VLLHEPFRSSGPPVASLRTRVDGLPALRADHPEATAPVAAAGTLPRGEHCLTAELVYRVRPPDMVPFVTYRQVRVERQVCFDAAADLTIVRIRSGNHARSTERMERGYWIEVEAFDL
jgi:hypothetical protein